MNALASAEAQSIHVEYDLPHPPSKVWRALTESGLLASWLMANDIEPVVGHRFTFKAPPMPGWDGTVHCEVLEVQAQKLLRYSWRGGAEASRLDSVVTWTLTPSPQGTKLTLEHAGFLPRNAFAFDAMSKGWRGKMVDRLNAVLETLKARM
jgi:uncharacterized protein YndB with AHSA1/START domain